jgi:hypothetical protein
MLACLEVYDEIIRGWRKLRSEELHNLYSLPVIITMFWSRRMRWAQHVVLEKRKAYSVVVGKPEKIDQ